MQKLLLLIALTTVILSGDRVFADSIFDTRQCAADCAFRYGIKRDWGGGLMLPSDTIRRNDYLECVAECEKRSLPSFGDQDQ